MASTINSLYHSGPGWINDILTLQVFYDADLEAYTAIPHIVKDPATGDSRLEHHRPVFAGGALVRGFVRITAPPGRTVGHNGITARLESGLFALDDLNTRDLFSEERPIAPAGDVAGVVDVPFEFPGTGRRPLGESFEGALFSIRHQVAVTVGRPWYTFPVTASAPFAVQRVHDIHTPYAEREKEAAGAPAPAAAAAADPAASAAALYGPQTMTLDPFDDGGTCVFTYDKGCFELSEHITGAITFSGVSRGAPILLVKLAVVRIEYADEEVLDTVVFDDAIMDARRWRARKMARLGIGALSSPGGGAGAAAGRAAPVARAGGGDDEDDDDEDGDEESTPAPKPGATPLPDAEAGGGATVESGAAAGSSVSLGGSATVSASLAAELASWAPSDTDLSDPEPDPDLPVVGDVALNVDLDLAQLANAITPTQVMAEDELGVSAGEDDEDGRPAAAAGTTAAGATTPGGSAPLKEVSVRYFLRLTAYTGFDADARRWNASEVVLYRDRLYGRPVPVERIPRKIRAGGIVAAAGGAGAPGSPSLAGAPPPGSGASSASAAVLPPPPPSVPLPAPMTTPFAASLLLGRRGRAAPGTGAPLSPVVTPYFDAHHPAHSRGAPSGGAGSAASPHAGDDFDAESGAGVGLGPAAMGDANLASFLTKAVRINDPAA